MNTVTTQEIVEFAKMQAAAADLKVFIDHRYELSLDPTNRVDPMPKLEAMLIKYAE
jgi:hypothetical protein